MVRERQERFLKQRGDSEVKDVSEFTETALARGCARTREDSQHGVGYEENEQGRRTSF